MSFSGIVCTTGDSFAWTQGWFDGSRAPATSVAAADPAKAKLESDLAASEKARQSAEQRVTAADAEAIRARAEAEAASPLPRRR